MGFNDDPTDVISPQIMIATTIIPKVMSSLSIIGSLLMIHGIYNKHRRQRLNVNNNTGSGRKLTDHHLPMTAKCVVNMCITDIGSSFWSHLLGTWMSLHTLQHGPTQSETMQHAVHKQSL